MLLLLITLSLVFIGIGFAVTEKNARYLLAGYNTMREEDRQKVDLPAFLAYFRKFHLFLGVSLFLMGAILYYGLNKSAGVVFLGVYPILAYMYFLWSSARFSSGAGAGKNRIGLLVLGIALVFVAGIFAMALKEDKLIVRPDGIEIEGSYGEKIAVADIRSVELVGQLPDIFLRSNGSSVGAVRKGYFKTTDGETVKLVVHSESGPFLLLTCTDGRKIYYSADKTSNEVLYREIRKVLPPTE